MEAPLEKIILFILIALSSATYDFVVKPEFGEQEQDLNITAYVGQTSRLPCTVKHLSGKRVSWIRLRDLQVLSTGRHTFSTDLRISVLPGAGSKLRRPRDLTHQEHPHVLLPNKTDASMRYLNSNTKGSKNSKQTIDDIQRYILPKDISRKGTSAILLKIRPKRRIEGQGLQRKGKKKIEKRSLDSYIDKRTKRMSWFEDRLLSDHISFNPWSNYFPSSHQNQMRSKNIMSFRGPQQEYDQDKSLADLPVPESMDDVRDEAFEKERNAIAIYPQGSIADAQDSKSQKLAPNYIDGVWEPEDYTLQIKYTNMEDAGTYICQINTEPRIAQAVVLRVVKMRAEILGRRELFVKAGNPVKLSCRVNHGALSPGFILWYKGQRLVEYENSGGRIQVRTEAGGVSHLLLNNVQPEDSSNYTCSPAGGEPASLILSVIVDERQAAMHQGNHCPSTQSSVSTALLCVATVIGQALSYQAEQPRTILVYLIPSIFMVLNLLMTSYQVKITVVTLLILFLHILKGEESENSEDFSLPTKGTESVIYSGIELCVPSFLKDLSSRSMMILLTGVIVSMSVIKCFYPFG